jgi:hypothetical protein
VGTEPLEFCRAVESYLCQKNGGHLVRIVGPSFELVARWAADGIPFKVACRGIDRYCERYERRRTRLRPVRIDHCEADVREVFDEWRRAIGLRAAPPEDDGAKSGASGGAAADFAVPAKSSGSLPSHLERALTRLSTARALGRIGEQADTVIDQVSQALDDARGSGQGVRGEARRQLLERLRALDAELLRVVRQPIDPGEAERLAAEAEAELAAFRDTMSPDGFRAACRSAEDRLVRESYDLPIIAFT